MSIGTAPTQTAKSSAGEPRNASDFDASAWIGREIDGRYRVIELIASGGMGAVLAVEHMRLRHRLALKILLGLLALGNLVFLALVINNYLVWHRIRKRDSRAGD